MPTPPSRAPRTCAIWSSSSTNSKSVSAPGGGAAKIAKQHKAGKLTARERIAKLLDPGARFLEIGLLIAYDQYEGQAPAAGVVTGIGKIEGRPAVIVANDATVKAGSWWPETITKILRAQEIAMRNRCPIVYLVDSAGVNLPYQDGIFPGQYGAGRIFLYNSLMRRRLRVPQFAAVMGPCIAGGAYLPALSDIIIMVEKTSFMGLGGPNLVKGATGQVIDAESLGGAKLHTATSGVAHYMAEGRRSLPRHDPRAVPPPAGARARSRRRPARASHRRTLRRSPRRSPPALRDRRHHRPHLRSRRLPGIPARARARNALRQRAPQRPARGPDRQPPRLSEIRRPARASAASSIPNPRARSRTSSKPPSASACRSFICRMSPASWWAPKPKREGIIRAGAEMVESMASTTVPKIILTINHASGAGYYAMAGQGFDPNFTFSWPTARIGVMEGDSAVQALFSIELEK